MNRLARVPLLVDLLALAGLAAAVLFVLSPLGLTNRIPAGIDALTYFTPYWDYRMVAFRGGHLPLWNPFLFLGVPFLANPQAAVLYPLHWPLSWLGAAHALAWSAIIHAWIAGALTYSLGRRSFGLTRPAAFLAGLIFGLGGYALGRVESINQLNTLAWLPGMLWASDEILRASDRRSRMLWSIGLVLLFALQILAGHTQTLVINLVALLLYAIWPALSALARRAGAGEATRALVGRSAPLLLFVPAVALSAAQLLPTWELSRLGYRTGGLPFRQAVSFSLRPELLLQSVLPPIMSNPAAGFGTEAYAEWLVYVPVTALVLAAAALLVRNRPAAAGRPAFLAATGFFLALGAYNPVYWLLWRFVPTFDLFRAPVRWMALFSLGVALLAGLGLDAAGRTRALRSPGEAAADLRMSPTHAKGSHLTGPRWLAALLLLLAGAGLAALLLAWTQDALPPTPTLAAWIATGVAATALILFAPRRPAVARAGLILLALAECVVASRAMPPALATAPYAVSLRTAPAALLAATEGQPPAGRERFLSLSDIQYDPGDLAELRSLQADRLPAGAVDRMVRAAKQGEVLTPNLPLLRRLPALDGYDGGLLPLARYLRFAGLFVPNAELLPDGRLREQLQEIPPDRLLDLAAIRYVITDKQRDLWSGDIYYDLQQTVHLAPGEQLTLDLRGAPSFEATALGVVLDSDAGAPTGEIAVTGRGAETAVLALNGAGEKGAPAIVALPQPLTPAEVVLRADPKGAGVTVRGLSLIDERTGAHASVTLSPRGDLRRIHSGDAKVYERTESSGRAWLVHEALTAKSDDAAMTVLSSEDFDPRRQVVLIDAATRADAHGAALSDATIRDAVSVTSYEPEQIVLDVSAGSPGWVVIADTWYPGWQATVDGDPTRVTRANLMLRAVPVEAGRHRVELAYRPRSWLAGTAVSLVSLVALLVAALWAVYNRGARKDRGQP
jgi:hypothetical protein